MLEPHRKIDRFEDRMRGILSEDQIKAKDSISAAHRIVSQKKANDFLRDPQKHLRSSDLKKISFITSVKEKVRTLLITDFKNHVLCQHLKEGQITPLIGEALFWNILIPENQPQLDPKAAQAIFETYDLLLDLPREAHKGFPVYLWPYLRGHSIRVGVETTLLAQGMNERGYDINPEKVARAATLHDTGKIDPEIKKLIRKPRKLTTEELERVQYHAHIGAIIMDALRSKGFVTFNEEEYEMIYNGIREHHVRPDGKGYPQHLDPKKTSLIGKMIAITDSFDAMTSNRVYNRSRKNPLRYAREELKRCSGLDWDKEITDKKYPEGQFDPDLVRIFLELNLEPIFHLINN